MSLTPPYHAQISSVLLEAAQYVQAPPAETPLSLTLPAAGWLAKTSVTVAVNAMSVYEFCLETADCVAYAPPGRGWQSHLCRTIGVGKSRRIRRIREHPKSATDNVLEYE